MKETPSEDVLYGRRPVLELLRTGRSVDRVFIAQNLAPSSVLGEIRKRAEEANVPIRMVPKEQIDRMVGGANHQGVAAVAGRFRYTPLEELLVTEAAALLVSRWPY